MDVLSFLIGRASAGNKSSGGSTEVTGSYIQDVFEVTAATMTVEHGGSTKPDFILVSLNDIPSDGYLFFSYGFSQAMLDKLGGGYLNNVTLVGANGVTTEIASNEGFEGNGSSYYSKYGGIGNVTDKSFTVGTDNIEGQLKIGATYSYIAVFGLA